MDESPGGLALRSLRRDEPRHSVVRRLLSLPAPLSDDEVEKALLNAFEVLVREDISFVRRRMAG